MKLPNFLIVGAAKCGTTSVYHYLMQHPEIYMSPVKEPKFITAQVLEFPFKGIGDENVEKRIIKNFYDYKKLFENVANEKAIGEASVDYLYYYDGAIKNIKKYFGDVKIIIMLRNPVERTYSQYLMLRKDQREFLTFEKALAAEEARKLDNWEFIWYYKDLSFYCKQVKAYLDNFNQVRIYLFDDLKRDPFDTIKDMFSFLGVDSSFMPNINRKYNISGVPRNDRLYGYILKPDVKIKKRVRALIQFFIDSENLNAFKNRISNYFLRKPQMNMKTKDYLRNLFKGDIIELQKIIDNDLSSWLN